MSNLPADVPRCAGRDDPVGILAKECEACLRRTDRSTFPLPVWTAPPAETPCPLRLGPRDD